MKKSLSFIAAFMLFTSINTNAINIEVSKESQLLKESCFSGAREFVIAVEGEINLGNVEWVLTLTRWCESQR